MEQNQNVMGQSVVLGACDIQKHRILQNYWACRKQKRKGDAITWRQIWIQKDDILFKIEKKFIFLQIKKILITY